MLTTEIIDLIETQAANSVIQNLFYLGIYSLVLIAASAWAGRLAYMRGAGKKLGELAVIKKNQKELLEYAEKNAAAVQDVAGKLNEKFLLREKRRAWIEEVTQLSQQNINAISNMRMVFSSQKTGQEAIRIFSEYTEKMSEMQARINTLCTLYFPDVLSDCADSLKTTQNALHAVMDGLHKNGFVLVDVFGQTELERAHTNSAKFIGKLMKRYAEEAGIEESCP